MAPRPEKRIRKRSRSQEKKKIYTAEEPSRQNNSKNSHARYSDDNKGHQEENSSFGGMQFEKKSPNKK